MPQVKAGHLIIEREEVCKGIVEVVSERGITRLVMGTTSAGGAISKFAKQLYMIYNATSRSLADSMK